MRSPKVSHSKRGHPKLSHPKWSHPKQVNLNGVTPIWSPEVGSIHVGSLIFVKRVTVAASEYSVLNLHPFVAVARPEIAAVDIQCNAMQVDHARKKECAVRVKEEKDYSFREEIMKLVDYCCSTGTVPDCCLPTFTKKTRETKGKVRVELT